MASIKLDRIWLMDPLDPSGALPLLWTGKREFGDTLNGGVREYADGRFRAVATTGRQQSVSVTVATDKLGLEILQSWKGKTLLYRDGTGARWYGTFHGAPWSPAAEGGRDVKLEILQVTYDESV